MNLTLRVWRQAGPEAPGDFETYEVEGATEEMSFPELLDLLNERLVAEGREPVAFESDCREGICGACGLMIDGQAHGPQKGTATCQLHLRRFNDGDVITVEPFRSAGFPLVKDLVVKGAGRTLKQGTLIKSIRLTGDPQEIDCKFEGIKGLVRRAEFVRKRGGGRRADRGPL